MNAFKPIARTVLIAALAVTAVTAVNAVTTAATAALTPPRLSAHTVVLPTGERLAVPVRGAPTVLPDRAGHVPRVTIARSGDAIYAIPDEAAPFVGRVLDAGLFDTTRLAALPGGRIPVRATFTGSAVPIPGVTGGYLTDTRAFRAALTRRIAADPATARSDGTPFVGVRNIALDLPAAPVAHPDFPMVTLTVRTVMPADGAVLGAFALITNLDDTRRYDTMVEVPPGNTFKLSVPQGNYAVLGNIITSSQTDGAIDHAYFPIAEDVAATDPEQAVTLDARKATATPSFSVPRPADVQGGFLNLVSFDGKHNYTDHLGGFVAGYDASVQVTIQPTPAPAHGVLWFIDQQQRAAADPAARYTYDLAQTWKHGIPADLHTDVRTADVATIVDHFYADGSPRQASFGRAATFPDWPQKVATADSYSRPGIVTNYVYGPSGVQWQAFLFQYSATGGGMIESGSAPETYRAGRTYRADWLRGPLGPGIAKATAPFPCLACRTGDELLLGPATTQDGDPDHEGDLWPSLSGFARMQVFQDGTSIADLPDQTLATIPVPADEHSYQIVASIDLGRLGYLHSTQATTEYTVTSSATSGNPVPNNWQCWLSDTERCTVVPLLTVNAPAPTSLTDTVTPGTMSFVVTVGHVEHAPPSAITSLTLATSLDGMTYTPAGVTDLGNGRYRVTVDTPATAVGKDVSVRMHAADAAGSTITETVRNAYTVEGS